MANTFLALPVPATDGVGAWVDVSGLSPAKTLTLDGGAFAGQLFVECSNNGQVSAAPAPVPILQAGLPNAIEFVATLQWMRVRRVGSSSGPAGTPAVVVGAPSSAGNVFATLAVPAVNGTGAPSSLAAGGEINTFAVVGPFVGSIFIELSNDGTDFSSNLRFDSGAGVPQTFVGVVSSARVRQALTSGSPLPTVAAGSGSDSTAGTAGVLSVTAGTGGVTITGTGANPVVNVPVAVQTITAGPGISVTGTATAPVVNNTGVLTITAGAGISVTGTAGAPIITNTGQTSPLTFSDGVTRTVNNVTNDVVTGKAGGNQWSGGTAATDPLDIKANLAGGAGQITFELGKGVFATVDST